MTRIDLFLCSAAILTAGCSSSGADPKISEFNLDPTIKTEVETAAKDGDGASGSYSYDASAEKLTVDFTQSSFGCGIETGSLVATVTELTASQMTWTFADDDDDSGNDAD